MRSSGVIKVLYVVRKASQYKTRSVEQKTEGKKQRISVEVQPKFPINLLKLKAHHQMWRLQTRTDTLQRQRLSQMLLRRGDK